MRTSGTCSSDLRNQSYSYFRIPQRRPDTCPRTNWASMTTSSSLPSSADIYAYGFDPEFSLFGSASLRVGDRTTALIGGQECQNNTRSNRFDIWIADGADEETESPWVSQRPHRQMEVKRKMPVAIVGRKEDLCRKL